VLESRYRIDDVGGRGGQEKKKAWWIKSTVEGGNYSSREVDQNPLFDYSLIQTKAKKKVRVKRTSLAREGEKARPMPRGGGGLRD